MAAKSNHGKLLIKTTSLLSLPRVSASCLPSRDQSKSKISPDSKFVICFGGPPPNFCCQMLETPLLVNAYSTESAGKLLRGSIKGDVKEKHFSLRPRNRFLASSPGVRRQRTLPK